MRKRIISFLLAFLLIIPLFCGGAGTVHAASSDDIEAIVEAQIRAFADTLDQKDADDSAAAALAKHGMRGGGKTLTAGAAHPLTAAIFNSEVFQTALTKGCAAAIQSMQVLDLAAMPYILGHCIWSGEDSFYNCASFDGNGWAVEDKDFALMPYITHTGSRNAYDGSLDWIAANTEFFLNIKRAKVTAAEVTYTMNCTVRDRFDFSTGSGSGFKNLISGLGALLFREFTWESSAAFELTVPYSCTHSSGAYRWTYDPEAHCMTSDGTDGFVKNETTRHTFTDSSGSVSYCYELDETVRLYHDEPWVLEYDIKNPGSFVLTSFNNPSASTSASMPCLRHWRKDYLFLWNEEHLQRQDKSHRVRNFYGTALNGLFSYSDSETYTFRLENEITPDGNMLCLTVHNTDTGALLLEKVPMDDYYRYETWVRKLIYHSDADDWVSGKDLFINYIGNVSCPFSADYFELRIWENGRSAEAESHCHAEITAPTCTTRGYTTYTCACCGYSCRADEVEALGHDYRNYVCTVCGDRTYIPGDVDLDYDVDVDDALALLWSVLFPEEHPIGVNADFDRSGTTDVDDALALLWYVLFPEVYPLS